MEILIQKVEKFVIITSLDEVWKDHLYYLNHIKEAIHLRAYAQKDPLIEYKNEAFQKFEELIEQNIMLFLFYQLLIQILH